MCQSIQIEVMTADIVSWTQLSIANLHLEDMCISLEGKKLQHTYMQYFYNYSGYI